MSVRGRRTALSPLSAGADAAGDPESRWPELAQDLGRIASRYGARDAAAGLSHALDVLLDATDAELAVVARYEGEMLVCCDQRGISDARLGPGRSFPLRRRAPIPATHAFLLGSGASPEPFGEYLRVAGFRSAVVFTVGPSREPSGVILLAYRADGALTDNRARQLAATIQPLDALLLAAPGDAYDPERQRQVEHSQKMEALGSMAGMIAHDFNNLLTTILGYTSILKNAGRMNHDDDEFLGHIEEAAHRAADLTARLLAFARGGVMRTGPLDLRSVVSDTIRLAEPVLQNRVEIVTTFPPEAVPVEGDEGQLQQCILNILLNARDAMPDGGRVTLEVRHDGPLAVLSIADDGLGMDESVRERIFDPYFTTKPKGSGTGLGMSITYGVMKGHRGDISVDSVLGEGTVFTLRLPALDMMPAAADTARMAEAERDLVLVVDDDDMVRRTTVHTVAHLGYNVVDAPSGRVAIDLVRARPDRFAVVLLDLVMPELTGSQTFKELRVLRESLPVVVCTGYAADAHLDDSVRNHIAGLIHKPFTADRLAVVLSELNVRKARR